MTDRPDLAGRPAVSPPQLFPPLGNPALGSIAVADVAGDPVFDRIVAGRGDRRAGRAVVDDVVDRWLGAAVRAANDRGFRFELRGLHPPSGPRWADLSQPADAAEIGGPHLAVERGTTKLVVVLGVSGAGRASLQAPGLATSSSVGSGQLAIWPAYLAVSVSIEGPADGALVVLATTAHGPAFR